VKLGAFHREGVEVESGVTPGETVVTRGHGGLIDGALVRVAESSGQAAPTAAAPPADGVASAVRPDGSSL
jgi:hypothetical protein